MSGDASSTPTAPGIRLNHGSTLVMEPNSFPKPAIA